MMSKITIEMVYTGDRFSGETPIEVVRDMKRSALFEQDIADGKYKDRVAQRTKLVYGEELDTASAKQFLESLKRAGLIQYMEER
jgi:predicted transcriptional regulator